MNMEDGDCPARVGEVDEMTHSGDEENDLLSYIGPGGLRSGASLGARFNVLKGSESDEELGPVGHGNRSITTSFQSSSKSLRFSQGASSTGFLGIDQSAGRASVISANTSNTVISPGEGMKYNVVALDGTFHEGQKGTVSANTDKNTLRGERKWLKLVCYDNQIHCIKLGFDSKLRNRPGQQPTDKKIPSRYVPDMPLDYSDDLNTQGHLSGDEDSDDDIRLSMVR